MMASLGGAIEELEGGMAQGMQEGGAVGDSLVDDFLSLPSNYSPKESKQFVRGNPRLTKLLRTLIVARGMGDMGKLNTKFAEAYKNAPPFEQEAVSSFQALEPFINKMFKYFVPILL